MSVLDSFIDNHLPDGFEEKGLPAIPDKEDFALGCIRDKKAQLRFLIYHFCTASIEGRFLGQVRIRW